MDDVPTLLAFRHRDRWRAHCEFCEVDHIYRGLGLQEGRCPQFTPHVKTGVLLVNGGVWRRSPTVKYIDRRI
jgi:hypothetical protein